MNVIESSSVGLEVLEGQQQALVIGISINNSYFKEENLEHLFRWAVPRARCIYVMIPDEPMVHTFMALGYTEQKAVKKSRLKGNALETKCRAVLNQCGFDYARILRWEDIVSSREYTVSLNAINALYELDIAFQSVVYIATQRVLHSNGLTDPSSHQIDVGVGFLLKELAFICYADQILVEEKVAYVYHKTTEILRDIIDGKYMFRASPNVGFITVH